MKIGDQVRITEGRLRGRSANITDVVNGPPEHGGVAYFLLKAPTLPTGEYRAHAHEIELTHAREQGYTGDLCDKCGGCRMLRAGPCLKCDDCGETTGCG
jgi:hypothetical protein